MAILDKKTIELGEGSKVLMDVNPNSEYVNFRLNASDKGTLVKKVDLWAACFAIADAKTQEMLMPVRQTEMVTYGKLHRVKVKKPLKVGDEVVVRCKINVPQVIHEGLAGSLMKKRSKILIPM